MLRLERVSKFYSGNGLVSTGFSKVDLEFHLGEFVAITGESGSGKSTLLNVISGLDSYEEGEMFVMGEPTSGYSKEDLEEYRKKYIGNIFQTFNLINSYTVYQNIELVLLLSGYNKKQIPARVKEIIEKVGLSGFEKKKASKLSGGQKQRVAIARALAKETPIIVADEPTGNLDVKSASEIIALLHELSKDKLIIIVTHNYEQVEPYVTRKITMHDGRVAEDKQLAPYPAEQADESNIKTAKADSLSIGSQARLGIRNTFNIPAKFMLLLLVFLFLCSGVIAMYATSENMGESMDGGWNQYFVYSEKDRILVTKENRGEFTAKDYEKLEAVENVERIVKNDLTLDLRATILDDYENGNFWINGQITDAAPFKDQLEEGRMPKNSKEGILMMPRIGYAADQVGYTFEKKVMVNDDYTGNPLLKDKLKIVGYGFLTEDQEKVLEESGNYTEAYLCVNEKGMDQIRFACLEKYCKQTIAFAGSIVEGQFGQGMYPLLPAEEVPQGQIYIPEDIAYMSQYEATGQSLELTNESLYFEDEFDFTVGAVYTKENCTYYLGIDPEDFDSISGSLYLNPQDYQKIFDKGNFQSSVMTVDEKLTKETAKKIEEAGFKTFIVNEGRINYDEDLKPVMDIFRVLLLAGVLIVLFFITYFIVKLILKSRNIYYSTIRMLGATKENCSSLLKIELFIVFNISFFVSTGFVWAVKQDMVPVDELINMASFLSAGDFAVLYIVLCVMTILLAARYAKQLFKQTAMNAYKEEV